MEDLNYIVGMGFTSADGIRAVIIALIVSQMMQKYAQVWTYTGIAFGFDRMLPFLLMITDGRDLGYVGDRFWDMVMGMPEDLGVLSIRFMGMMIIISLGFAGRSAIHQRFA
ncbi:MAG: hypothetical protein AAGC95_06390 [Pseudomonadota bacterium]